MTYQSIDLSSKKYQDNSAKLVELIQSFPLVDEENEHLLLKKMKERIGFAKIKHPMDQGDIKKVEIIALPTFDKDGYPGKLDLVSAKITYADGSKQLHLLDSATQDQLELINTLSITLGGKAEKSFLSTRVLVEEHDPIDWEHRSLDEVYSEDSQPGKAYTALNKEFPNMLLSLAPDANLQNANILLIYPGCGAGRDLHFMKDALETRGANVSIVGFDINPDSLRTCQDLYPEGIFFEGDINCIDEHLDKINRHFAEQNFDVKIVIFSGILQRGVIDNSLSGCIILQKSLKELTNSVAFAGSFQDPIFTPSMLKAIGYKVDARNMIVDCSPLEPHNQEYYMLREQTQTSEEREAYLKKRNKHRTSMYQSPTVDLSLSANWNQDLVLLPKKHLQNAISLDLSWASIEDIDFLVSQIEYRLPQVTNIFLADVEPWAPILMQKLGQLEGRTFHFYERKDTFTKNEVPEVSMKTAQLLRFFKTPACEEVTPKTISYTQSHEASHEQKKSFDL